MNKLPGRPALAAHVVALLAASLSACGGGGDGNAPGTAPAAPTGVSAAPGTAQVVVTWSASPGAVSYRIYFGTSPTQTKASHEGVYDTGEQSFTFTGLPYGTPTYFTVTARNQWGEGAESATISSTPVEPLSPPLTPTGVTVVAGNAQVTVSWTAVAGATAYNVYYGTGVSQTKASHGAVAANHTSGSAVTGLANNTLHYFVVTAVGPGGESTESETHATMPVAPPAAPTNVVAVAGKAQVALSWTAVAGAVSYNVYYGTAPTQTKASHGATSLTGDALATIGGLTNDVTYYFSVTAGNSSGVESDESATISAVPHLPIPVGVAAAAGSGQVTITWTAVPFASSYNLYQATATGVTPANGTKVAGVTSPSVQTGLTNGTTYYFVVTEVTGGLESPASAEVSATPALPVVQGVTAVAGNAQVTIDWTVVAGASSYNVYYSTVDGVTTATGTKVAGATRPYVLTGLANNTTYYFIVTELTGGVESAASLQQAATPALPSPVYVVATAGVGQVTVNWNGAAGATGYNLYYSSNAGVTPATGTKVTDTPKPATVTGLTNGTKYYFIVTAVFPSGESAPSALLGVSSATPLAPPAAPTGLVATGAGTQINLTWAAAAGATTYSVYRSTSPSVAVTAGNLIAQALSGTTYTDVGLYESATRFYVVTGVNAVAEGAPSNEASGTTKPLRPEDLTATGGVGQVALAWTASPGANTYSLYRSLVQTFTLDAAHRIALGIGGTTYTDTDVEAGTLYYYVATASNAVGESVGSARVAGPTAPLALASLDAVGGVAQITLTWPASPGATRYDLYYSTSAGVTPGTGTRIGTVTSPYTHANLTNAGTYYYVVTAFNNTVEGPASPEANAVALPGTPASVRAVGGVGQNVVTWAPVSGATSYNVYWSTSPGVTTSNGTLITGATSPYAHTALSNGTPCYYVVTAQQSSLEGLASS